LNINEIIKAVNRNDWVIFGLAAISVVGFVMTVYVSLKTKSISKILKLRKSKEKYNLQRHEYSERFQSYRDSILIDNNYNKAFINKILVDFHQLKNFRDMFNNKEKKIIKSEIKKLEDKNMTTKDFKETTDNLAYFISRFNEREDLDG